MAENTNTPLYEGKAKILYPERKREQSVNILKMTPPRSMRRNVT